MNSAAALNSALVSAVPGSEIVIANGSYSGWNISALANGNMASPVVIRAQNQGQVTLANSRFTFTGTFQTLSGVNFQTSGGATFSGGQSNRVTACSFLNMSSGTIFLYQRANNREANNNRLDQILVQNSTAQILNVNVNAATGKPIGVLIDHSQFISVNFSDPNSIGIFQFGNNNVDAFWNIQSEVSDNLFDHCGPGDVFHIKASGLVLKRNTFKFCGGNTFRQGQGNSMLDSRFEDNLSGTVPLRLLGKNHVFKGNTVLRGPRGTTFEFGNGDGPGWHYETPANCLVESNTYQEQTSEGIFLGDKQGSSSNDGPRNQAPYNNTIKSNKISMSKGTLLRVNNSPNNTIDSNCFNATGTAQVGTAGTNPTFGSCTGGSLPPSPPVLEPPIIVQNPPPANGGYVPGNETQISQPPPSEPVSPGSAVAPLLITAVIGVVALALLE